MVFSFPLSADSLERMCQASTHWETPEPLPRLCLPACKVGLKPADITAAAEWFPHGVLRCVPPVLTCVLRPLCTQTNWECCSVTEDMPTTHQVPGSCGHPVLCLRQKGYWGTGQEVRMVSHYRQLPSSWALAGDSEGSNLELCGPVPAIPRASQTFLSDTL